MSSIQSRDSSTFPFKVVIDTNVFISGLFYGGLPEKLFKLIDNEVIKPCFSRETFTELHSLLLHPKFQKQRERLPFPVSHFLKNLFLKSNLVYPDKMPQIIKEDPFDNHFLACASTARASFIITGDKHLLKLKKFQDIFILTPKEFLKKLK